MTTLVELLGDRAINQSGQTAYTFLANGETPAASLSYQELDRQAKAIATELQTCCRSGDRVLLLYPSGLEFIAAFFGCLYAGVVAVPLGVPRRHQNLQRWQAIAKDAQARVVLTTATVKKDLDRLLAKTQWNSLLWLASDRLVNGDGSKWVCPDLDSDTLAFLQYTSGSTGTPKGVMVTHGNLLHNERTIEQAFRHSDRTIVVGWLPLFHDMGLIGNVLQPVYLGIPSILMSPTAFLQKPIRWLNAITKYKATTSGAPNFAYDLCVQKIKPEQLTDIDLSSWEVAFNGAEPIRAETLAKFTDYFRNCGFRPEAFYPCYGMAEATLFITGNKIINTPQICQVDKEALKHNRVVTAKGEKSLKIVGCGHWLNQKIVIVNPETLNQCKEREVGEIWVSGKSVAAGYWHHPELTEQTFQAHLRDTESGTFLRTGDLGFWHQELFVTGRLKDLIIIRGRNYYPQDIELTVEKSHPSLRESCGAAFLVEVEGVERLVVTQEVKRTCLRSLDVSAVTTAIRQAVSENHQLDIYVVLIKTGSIPKTSSGKIQRHACRDAFLRGDLSVVGETRLEKIDETIKNNEKLSEVHMLSERIAQIMGIAPSRLDLHQPLTSLGLNSLKAIEIKNLVEEEFNLDLPIESFWDNLSVTSLVAWMRSQHEVATTSILTVPQSSLESSQAKTSTNLQFSLLYFSSNEAEFAEDKYQLLIEGAKWADKNDFSAVWLPERHFHAFGGLYPNPSVLGAALAMVTERIRIRAGSVVIPLHNPVRVAEEWSVVDNLSKGRIDLAFARGWNPNDFVLSPETYSNSREFLYSGIETIKKLWRGESHSLTNGTGKQTDIRIYPLPYQQQLAIWLTCSGGKERFIEAGAMGVNILTALLFQPIEELAEKIALYRQARSENGHDPDTGQVTLMLHTFVSEDLGVVRKKVRQPFIDYLKSSVNLWRQGAKSLDDLNEQEQEQLLAYAFERYFQTSALFGTPESCLSMCDRLKEIGVNEIACLIDFGIDSDSVLSALYSLKRLKQISGLLKDTPADIRGQSRGGSRTARTEVRVGANDPSPVQGSVYPLSYGQKALWFLYRLNRDSAAYNTAFTVRIRSALDVSAWRNALQKLVARHPILRTSFKDREGEPYQEVKEVAIPFEEINATDWTEDELKERVIKDYQRPFNLEQGQVLRASLFTRSPQEYVFMLAIHHIVRDGWSMLLLINELRELYIAVGQQATLPPLKYDYQDYVQWQAKMLAEDGERLENYWRNQLAGELPVLNLPTDTRLTNQTNKGASYSFKLDEITDRLKELAKTENATLYMTLLAAFQVLLHRYTGQDDILIGSPTAGRSAKFAQTVGYFVTLVVLRSQFTDNLPFKSFLAQARQTVLEAIAHQDYPYSLLVELQPDSSSSLVRVVFAFQELQEVTELFIPQGEIQVDWNGLKLEPFVIPQEEGQFDLTLEVIEGRESLFGVFKYNSDLFEESTIERMAEHFQNLLQGIVANPDAQVSQLSLLSEVEKHQLLVEWNSTEVEYPQDKCIHQLFEAQVAKTPDAIAIVFQDRQLTYRELNDRANRLAHYLQSQGVAIEELVGLCVERTPLLIIGLLGILKAGAAYVPLDPSYPTERLAFMLDDSGVKILLTQQELIAKLPENNTQVICLDRDPTAIAKASKHNPTPEVQTNNLAYVIYTSGSTGRPKGVLVNHSGLVNLVFWHQQAFNVTASDRATQLAGMAFDAAGWEIYPYLTAGATIYQVDSPTLLSPVDLQTWLIEREISISFVPTAIAERLLSLEWSPDIALRIMLTGGDKLHSAPSASIPFKLVNNYGPTENTVVTTSGIVANDDINPAIGRPIANTKVYILDRAMQPVLGIPGELHISGAGLARGYLNRPELTQQKFIPNPFVETLQATSLLYKTGDLARYLSDGSIEYLGRIDNQVKIRGFRIELGEIESVLARHPQIKEIVAIAREDEPFDPSLVAYVVPDRKGEGLFADTSDELRSFLKQKLPEYMIPSAFVWLETIPLTPNGKVDRHSLPIPSHSDRCINFVSPQTPTQEILATIWAELGLEQVGIYDNFFDLGGHSLLATQVISRVRSTFTIELPLQSLFSYPTVEKLSQQIETIRQQALGIEFPEIEPVERTGNLPLSFAQTRLWFLSQLEGTTAVYNIPGVLRLRGTLQVKALKQALVEIVRRHEVLRTRFDVVENSPVQIIESDFTVNLPIVDLQNLPDREQSVEIQRLVRQEAQTPFDLSQASLLRVTLLRLTADEHILLLTMHHIVADGWSLGVLLQELSLLYVSFANEPLPLPELPIQYADFAVWQRQHLQVRENGSSPLLNYWQQQLQDAPPLLELPTDYPRPARQTFSGSSEFFTLDKQLASSLEKISQKAGTTLFMTLLAVWGILLSRYSRQEELVIGTAIANRNRKELEPLIGFFVNTLALRLDLKDNPNFSDFLKQVRQVTLDAYTHQDLPFEQLVEELQPERNLSHTPIFQVMFVLDNGLPLEPELPGLEWEILERESVTAKFDFTLSMRETEAGLTGTWEYNSDLFESGTITRAIAHFQTLLQAIVTNCDRSVAQLPLLTDKEQQQLLIKWNDTEVDYPQKCLHQLFEAQVERTPNAVAVVWQEQLLTYAELNTRANQLAHYLQSQGVKPEVLVGICVERSHLMVIALLAILKAGGAYVPLDPDYPSERLGIILDDADVILLLTQEKLKDALPSYREKTVYLDTDWSVIASENPENTVSQVKPDNLAYVIYTSGSTGRPKGVAIAHRSPVTLMFWAREVFTSELAGVLASTSICFDLSVFELFVTLSWGGKVILAENALELPNLPAAGEVTLINTVPSAIAELLRIQGIPKTVRTVNLAGEPLAGQIVQQLYQQKHIKEVYNLYGPSEDTTYSTFTLVENSKDIVPTIGRAIANTQTYILDRHLQPVPIGVPGELHLGGMGLARGYLNQPELTQQKFIANPFVGEFRETPLRESRFYKTGDLAKYQPNGKIQYLGRIDNQVKIRGFRIELGEIETALNNHPQVRQGVVIVREDDWSDKRLVAYIVSEGKQPVCSDLRDYLKQKLPEYMIPSAFVLLEAIPFTPNGKIDRRALPAPKADIFQEFVLPRTPTQSVLAAIWAEVLKLQQVGIEDNFFELGGHSLLATQVISRIREAFELEIPLNCLFANPTIKELSQQVEIIRQQGLGIEVSTIEPVARTSYLPLSYAQQRLWFLEQLEGESAAYNMSGALQIDGSLNLTALEQALQEIERRHEVLRTYYPMVEGSPVQAIASNSSSILQVVDLQDLPTSEQSTEVRRLARVEAENPFDLSKAPLLRIKLLRLGQQEHILLLTMHHIISDGWSLGILVRELSVLYGVSANTRDVGAISPSETLYAERYSLGRERESPLPELPIQYADFAVWQRQWLSSQLDRQLSYWKQQLKDAPPILELPTDYPRPPVQSFRGRNFTFALDKKLTSSLLELSRQSQVTLFMTLLSAFAILLSRYSQQEDLVIGSPIANRNRRELESLIGFFVNTLALRFDLKDNPSFIDFLQRVRQTTLEAYTHQDLPFEQLVEELQPERTLSHTPLFQVMFALQNAPTEELELPGLSLTPLKTETVRVRFDLVLSMVETETGLEGSWEYNSDLFDEATISRMAEHFQMLLQGIVANPEQSIYELPLLTQAEQQLLAKPLVRYEVKQCLHQMFETQVEKSPNAVAVVFENEQLTYQELNIRANQLAHYLQSLGVKPEVLVAICVERSHLTIVGILGILKAGGAYLPLDPTYPQERLALMLNDSQVSLLVTQEKLKEHLPKHEAKEIYLDTDWQDIARQRKDNPVSGVTPSGLAYVIYTSGSTGTPKGVLINHGNVMRLFAATQSWFNFDASDVWTMFHSYAFDFSVWELWGALLHGGRLVVVPYLVTRSPEAFYKLLAKERVTVVNQTPSAFRQLIWADNTETTQKLNLRLVIFGGEALEIQSLKPWFDKYGDCTPQLVNMYGITETTVHVTYRPLSKDDLNNTASAIGIPIPDLQVYILDRHLQPVPIGVPGEMYVAGAGLARGYLHRPELTAERFINNPFVETHATSLLYKTGDSAKYLSDGSIEYLGRLDNQVKIRGFRIELGEIETAIAQHPGVRETVVIAREDEPDKRLVAYIVPDEKHAAPVLRLIRYLEQGRLTDKSLYELPNGMAIAHLNKSETDFVYREIFERLSYLRHGITINDGDCIFDVGANIGLFTLLATQTSANVEVYAFEPIPPVFELLQLNTELYGLDVKLFDVGLSERATEATFTYYPHVSVISGRFANVDEEQEVVKSFLLNRDTSESTELSPDAIEQLLAERLENQQFTCQLKTISEVIEENNVEQIDLLKIDVEKSELEVLKGIKAEHWHKIKQIVVEVHDREGRLAKITQMLEKYGYEFTIDRESELRETELYNIYARRKVGERDREIGRQGDRETGSNNFSSIDSTQYNWNSRNVLIGDIRDRLKEKLPEYTIPSAFCALSTIPLTSNGKVDYRALPVPEADKIQQPIVSPRSETEKILADIWSEVLGIDRVSIYDNFFDLGGHSLLATQVTTRLRDRLGVELPLRYLFAKHTLVSLAHTIEEMGSTLNQLQSAPTQELDDREEFEI